MSPFIVALLVVLMAKSALSRHFSQRKLATSARAIVGAKVCRYLRRRKPVSSRSNEGLERIDTLKDQDGSGLLLVAQMVYANARAKRAGIRLDIDLTRVSRPRRAAIAARAATLEAVR